MCRENERDPGYDKSPDRVFEFDEEMCREQQHPQRKQNQGEFFVMMASESVP